MDCNTVTNNNNYLLVPISESGIPRLRHDKDVPECQGTNPRIMQDHYRDFITETRVCDLNRYKYYHPQPQPPLHQQQHLHHHQSIYNTSAAAHLEIIGSYERKSLDAGGFTGNTNHHEATSPVNVLLDLMDSTAAAAAAQPPMITADEDDNNKNSSNRRNVDQPISSDGVLIIDCHNSLAKYSHHDQMDAVAVAAGASSIYPRAGSGKYHMEASIYMCHRSDEVNSRDAIDSDCTRTGGYDGEEFNHLLELFKGQWDVLFDQQPARRFGPSGLMEFFNAILIDFPLFFNLPLITFIVLLKKSLHMCKLK